MDRHSNCFLFHFNFFNGFYQHLEEVFRSKGFMRDDWMFAQFLAFFWNFSELFVGTRFINYSWCRCFIRGRSSFLWNYIGNIRKLKRGLWHQIAEITVLFDLAFQRVELTFHSICHDHIAALIGCRIQTSLRNFNDCIEMSWIEHFSVRLASRCIVLGTPYIFNHCRRLCRLVNIGTRKISLTNIFLRFDDRTHASLLFVFYRHFKTYYNN